MNKINNKNTDDDPIVDSRSVIKRLLNTGFKLLSIYEQLQEALSIIMTIPWLEAINQGVVFLIDPKGDLILIADQNLNPELKKRCARIRSGECLCGTVLKHQEILFRDCIDDSHTIHPKGMKPHGHYVLPLKDKERLMGVITFYVKHGHHPASGEQDLMEDLAQILSLLLLQRMSESSKQVKEMELEDMHAEVLEKLGRAAEYRDTDTGLHVIRMSHYAAHIGSAIGLSDEEVDRLRRAATMHDVGKIGIPDAILLKPEKLTSNEFELMKQHSNIGEIILSGKTSLMRSAQEIAIGHHEKWDGSGYPQGLTGEDIPLFARICAIADVFDALTIQRPYKQAWSTEDALQFIKNNAGKHFEPKLVDVFEKEFPAILHLKTLYTEGGIDPSEKVLLPTIPNPEEVMVPWDANYSVNIPVVDEHHRYLFELINQLHLAIKSRENIAQIGRALKALEQYTRVHFSEEERMMENLHYDDLEAHKKQHQAFIAQLEKFWGLLKLNPLMLGNDMPQFFNDWLLNHILVTDRKMSQELGLMENND